jgi:hypothetical protein
MEFFAGYFDWTADPTAWVALLTLVVLEVVLGIDNLIFISILTNKLPKHQRPAPGGSASARRWSCAGAAGDDLVHRSADHTAVHRLRPWFLLARPDPDRRRPVPGLEGDQGNPPHGRSDDHKDNMIGETLQLTMAGAIFQILLLDLVFSIDSIITAVGMTDEIAIMYIAVIVAVTVMMLAAEPLANFIEKNPTIVMLALGFLLMIGMTLIADGMGYPCAEGLHLRRDGLLGFRRGAQHDEPPPQEAVTIQERRGRLRRPFLLQSRSGVPRSLSGKYWNHSWASLITLAIEGRAMRRVR